MSSTCSSENAFLGLFHQHSLFPTNFQATHKAGNVLDNILITENFHFEVNVKRNVTLNDHFPLVFECFIEKTPYQFDPLLSTYSFNSYEGISVFSNSWSNFSFESYPSNVVSSFYSHLLAMIPVAFRKKTKKRLFNPFYYSSHSIHCQNKLQTLRRRCSRNPTRTNLADLRNATKDFEESTELDRITFLTGHNMSSLSDGFNLLSSLKFSHLPPSMTQGTLTLSGDWVQQIFCFKFQRRSIQTKTYREYGTNKTWRYSIQNDRIQSFWSHRKTKPSAVAHDKFPSKFLHLCPHLFASLLMPVFCSTFILASFPEEWKYPFIKPLQKHGS